MADSARKTYPQLCYIQEKLAITLGCDLSNLKNNENSRRFVVVDNKVKLRNDIVPINNSIDIYIPEPQMPKEFDNLEQAIAFLREQDLFQL